MENLKEEQGGYDEMELSGDSRAEGTLSPVAVGPARGSQLCLLHLGVFAVFLSLIDVSNNKIALQLRGWIFVEASSSIQIPIFVKLLAIEHAGGCGSHLPGLDRGPALVPGAGVLAMSRLLLVSLSLPSRRLARSDSVSETLLPANKTPLRLTL